MIKAKSIDPVADMASYTDEDAIQQVRSGHTNMFEVIMRRYNQRLYRIARGTLICQLRSKWQLFEQYR